MFITHHGKALKRYLRLHSIAVKAFMAKVSKSRQTIYDWFELQEFDPEIMDKVVLLGGVPESVFQTKIDTISSAPIAPSDISTEDRAMLKMAMEILKSNTEYLQAQLNNASQALYSANKVIEDHVKRTNRKISTIEGYIIKSPR